MSVLECGRESSTATKPLNVLVYTSIGGGGGDLSATAKICKILSSRGITPHVCISKSHVASFDKRKGGVTNVTYVLDYWEIPKGFFDKVVTFEIFESVTETDRYCAGLSKYQEMGQTFLKPGLDVNSSTIRISEHSSHVYFDNSTKTLPIGYRQGVSSVL